MLTDIHDGVRRESAQEFVSEMESFRASELLLADDRLAAKVRAERDDRLAETDKIVLKLERKIRQAQRKGDDATELEAELEAIDDYREELCEIPEQPGFPSDITWPTEPS